MQQKIAEYILKEQTLTSKRRYFVKWKNLAYKYCSWVNKKDIQNFNKLYQKFREGNTSIDEDEDDDIDMIEDSNSIEIINNNSDSQIQQNIDDRLFKYTSKSSDKQESSIEIEIIKQKPSSSTNNNQNKFQNKKKRNQELNEDSSENNVLIQTSSIHNTPSMNVLTNLNKLKQLKTEKESQREISIYNNSYVYYKQKINKDLYNLKGIKKHYIKDKQFYFSLLWENQLITRHYNSYAFSYKYLKERNPKKLLEYLEPYLNKQIN